MISNANTNHTHLSPFATFAANYDCAAYGAGNYDDSTLCTTQAPNTGIAPANGALSGWTVGGIVLGVVLLISGIVLLVKKRGHASSK